MKVETFSVSNLTEREKILKEFDPNSSTWVVSDLFSKSQIQKKLFDTYPILPEISVLRANELWQYLYCQIAPQTQFVSKDLIMTQITGWLEKKKFPWAQTPGASQSMFNYLNSFQGILSHPEGSEVILHWLKDNSDANLRWGLWFRLCHEYWEAHKNQKIIPQSWAAGRLYHENSFTFWQRNLIFDLGPELSKLESEIILELSKQNDVKVLSLDSNLKQYSPKIFHPYDYLGFQAQDLATNPKAKSNSQFSCYSTMLAEIKAVTAQVRKWIDSGISQSRIAVISPQIETYWMNLKYYFEAEGIETFKPIVYPVSSFKPVQKCLAKLRILSGQIQSSDLEINCFSETQNLLNFDTFRELYTNLYDSSDLGRIEDLQQIFKAEYNKEDLLSRKEFVGWALKYWEPEFIDHESLDIILSNLREVPIQFSMKVKDWIQYLERLCSKLEIKTTDSNPDGVLCGNLDMIPWLDVDCVWVLGCCDELLKQSSITSLGFADSMRIFQETGFLLDPLTPDLNEMYLRIVDNMPVNNIEMSFPQTSFEAKTQSPNLFWLLGMNNSQKNWENPQVPEQTRLDQILESEVQAGEESYQLNAINKVDFSVVKKLSASRIEDYLRCPFIYAAKNIFKLSDKPELDIDIDHLKKGSLLHQILFILGKEPMKFDWSDEQIATVIDRSRAKEKIQIGEEKIWPMQKQLYVQMARRFLQFEKNWRKEFQQTQIVGRETSFNCSWDHGQKKLVPAEGGIAFSGKIDRIDGVEDGYNVIDYKSGDSSSKKNWKSWLENGQVQLPIYIYALTRGFSQLPPQQVFSAVFFSLKDMSRNKGLFRKEFYEGRYKKPHHTSQADDQDIIKLLDQINEIIFAVVEDLQQGQFAPKPRDFSDCIQCEWRMTCRAPHLN